MGALHIQQKAQSDYLFHIEQVQGVRSLEKYQKDIVRAIQDNDRVVIRSCHDLGKTFIMAKIVLALTSIFPGAKVITTAPTFNQVKRLLWSEIRAGWKRSKYPLGGEMLHTEWKIEEDWFALGFTSKGDADASEGQGTSSGFQGFHGKLVVILFDEATGISKQIWNQAEGMMTSALVKFIAIGNPTSRSSQFFQCFKDPSWHKMKLSCFDSPNLIANGITNLGLLQEEISAIKLLSDADKELRLKSYIVVQPQLLTLKAVVGAALKWGLEHPLFISKMLGDFPEEDENTIIPLGIVEKSQQRWENMKETTHAAKVLPMVRVIGVDCARFGPDKTVIVMIEDDFHSKTERMPMSSIPDIVGAVTAMINSTVQCHREEILVDGTGLGAGVVDGLRENVINSIIRKNVVIREINNGAAPDSPSDPEDKQKEDRQHYFNLKAKMFDLLADSLKKDLAVMPEEIYLEELPTLLYRFTPKGQLAIESKEDYKKRTGLGSPDDSDALALANFGRVDNGNIGTFTVEMTSQATARPRRPPFAGGLRRGDPW